MKRRIPASIDPDRLQSEFAGKVLGSDHEEYEPSRIVFYGDIDSYPKLIIRPEGSGDIARAIQLARATGLELAIRSGGHSFAGYSAGDGIVIDMRDMRRAEIDPESRTAWVDSGMTAGAFTARAAEHGLVLGFGDTGSVGVGGITLAGGIGFLVRKYGMTIDNLIAAEIVTADGNTFTVDDQSHPDLFWAIRGGGGNFGVATRFRFRLERLESVYGGMLILPATPETVSGFMAIAEEAPDELSAIVNLMPAPPLPFVPTIHHGKIILMAFVMYAGDPSVGEGVVGSLRKLAPGIADTVSAMRYPEIFIPDDDSYHPTAVAETLFMDRVDLNVASRILDALQDSDAVMRAVQLRVLGGAMARVPADATAFAHRQSRIMANIASFYQSPADKVLRQEWVTSLSRELFQGDRGAYIGFLGEVGPDRLKEIYPAGTWERLMQVKRKYDPENIFRRNHNISVVPGI